MNTKFLSFLLLILVSFSALGQKQKTDTIPVAVTSSFEREYPDSKVKDWTFKGNNYIADTKIDGQNAQAFFSNTGAWIETIYAVSEKEMPGRIDNYLTSKFPGSVVVSAQYKENKSNGAFYFIQLKKNKSSQEVDADLFFDVSGNFQTKTEYHPLTEALSSSTQQEADRKAKTDAEKAEYEARRAALLSMDRSITESEMPVKVKDNFKKKFPKAEQIKWDSLDNVYTARFIENEVTFKSDWNLTGDWKTTVETLPNGPIFRPVDQYLEENYTSYAIQLAQKITSRDKNDGYYLEVHPRAKKGASPPITKLHFDKAGRFLNAEEPEIKEVIQPEEVSDNISTKTDEPDNFETKLEKEDENGGDNKNEITSVKVSAKELPSKALTYIQENYPDYKVKEAFFDDFEDLGDCYKVTIRKEGVAQKNSIMFFSDRGVLLREDNPPPKKSELDAAKKEKEQERVKPGQRRIVEAEEAPENKVEKAEVEDDNTDVEVEAAEEIDVASVPDLVKKNFSRRYPRAVDPLWKSSEKKFIVEFISNDIKNILEFTPDGIIQVTRTETDPNTLPGPVKRYLEDNYKSYKIRYAEKIIRKDRKNYTYVEIYSKKRNASPPEKQLFFDKVGKIMQNPPE